jgi:hypothetical protein
VAEPRSGLSGKLNRAQPHQFFQVLFFAGPVFGKQPQMPLHHLLIRLRFASSAFEIDSSNTLSMRLKKT